jgi:MFS family permease
MKNKLKKRKRFTFSFKKRFIVGLFVIASNQISCINGIFYYAKQLLNSITKDEDLSQNLLIGLAFSQIIANLFSGKLIDKYGRKSIFLKGQFLIVIILTLVFLLDLKQMSFLSLSYKHSMMILLIFLHVIVFNISLGPICIFYCSEILDDMT